MASTHLKYFWLFFILLIFCQCDCGKKSGSKSLDTQETAISPNLPITPTTQSFYNLEAIDLNIEATDELGFSFNDQQLSREGDLYVSDDLIVYKNEEGKWQATVIGPGGINSHLKIFHGVTILKEVAIATKSEVFPYQDALGSEWPGIHNTSGTSCFANATYKFIARCSGFDKALSQDIPGGIHTPLRNIVNGIRLGKRSAFIQAAIQGKISQTVLAIVTKQNQSRNQYTSTEPSNGVTFFRNLLSIIYTTNSQGVNQETVAELLNQRSIEPFDTIKKVIASQDIYHATSPVVEYTHNFKEFSDFKFVDRLFIKSPQFIIVTSLGAINQMPDQLTIPLYDSATDKQIAAKKYRLIVFTRGGGHRIAYIYAGSNGWYTQDDINVEKADFSFIAKDVRNMTGIYELQDS